MERGDDGGRKARLMNLARRKAKGARPRRVRPWVEETKLGPPTPFGLRRAGAPGTCADGSPSGGLSA